ncbi:recombinase family protein [Listeria grandensis]|uniref:Recombinase family protein n=1 Tax=Listeria grandensis TaxID=1494963 RepID=A0A7X1CQZ6_9LIST|nr:recombinase family protein [Listeria grandensis]MBC1475951.1 recombinase family protein [Listeria grandensis]MBC1937556.1 recombinase family protein [Listeria grandensis]
MEYSQTGDLKEMKTKIYGYARVSTQEQSMHSQVDALESFGCQQIVLEKESGRKRRKELEKLFLRMEDGDTLVVTKLDRLSRTTKDLLEISEFLQKKNIHFISLKEKIDTSSPMGKFYFILIAAIAEMEVSMIRERTLLGLEAAKKRGRRGGRPKISAEKSDAIKQLISRGMSKKEIAARLKVSISTVYNYTKHTCT